MSRKVVAVQLLAIALEEFGTPEIRRAVKKARRVLTPQPPSVKQMFNKVPKAPKLAERKAKVVKLPGGVEYIPPPKKGSR